MMNLENYLLEDCPKNDLTTELLEIRGDGVIKIISRESGIAACTEDVENFLHTHKITAKCIPSGVPFKKDEIICEGYGSLKELFKVWRVSQTFLSITCAIAKKVKNMLTLAKSVNPEIIVATTRKTHPGMREYEMRAVIYGGGKIHRRSLSDSVLITSNHLSVISDLPKKLNYYPVEIEVRTREEAIKYANLADILLLDHFTPKELSRLVPILRDLNPKIKIAVAGDISETTIKDYSPYADIIITSTPYYAHPLNITTKIERI